MTGHEMFKIPITIGVTGHRDIRKQDIPRLRELVNGELQKLKKSYPDSDFVMLNSLAEGSDQLCAEIALELGFKLIAPLPLDISEYRKDFSGPALEKFGALCKSAWEVFTVPDMEESKEGNESSKVGKEGNEGSKEDSRNNSYRQAGIYISKHSQVMLALWDGSPPTAHGCGTAEAADFMLHSTYAPKYGSLFADIAEGAVIKIATPREGSLPPEDSFSVKLMETVPGSLLKILSAINGFNAEATPAASTPLIKKEPLGGLCEKLTKIHALYLKADTLSIQNRNQYLKSMKWLSIMGVLLVLGFLLYDELNSRLMLPLYALEIAFSYLILNRSRKGRWHEKYLEYRALSETLRIQFYLGLCGVTANICDSFTWSQKMEAVWVKKGVTGLLAGDSARQAVDFDMVRAEWIDRQLDYHRSKQGETGALVSKNAGLASLILKLSIGVLMVMSVMELFFPELLTSSISYRNVGRFLLSGGSDKLTVKGAGLISLGFLSSVTLFLSNYYGKLSLERKTVDHKKMAALYAAAQKKWNTPGILIHRVALELAREEIVENGVWLSYSRDNAPSVNL